MAVNDTVTPANFSAALLSAIGKGDVATDPNWQGAVNAWVASEGGFSATTSGGAAVNNPLNTDCSGWSGQIGCSTLSNGSQVGQYATLSDAVQSYANGLNNNSAYGGIIKSSTPTAFVGAVINSPWAGGNYAGDMGAWNAFLATQSSGGITAANDPSNGQSGGANPLTASTSGGTSSGITGNPIIDGLLGAANPFFNVPHAGSISQTVFGALGNTVGEVVINIIAIAIGVFMILFSIMALVKSGTGASTGDIIKLIPGPAEGQLAMNQASSASKAPLPSPVAPSRQYAGGSQATGPTPTVNVNAVASNETPRERGSGARAFLASSQPRKQRTAIESVG